MRERASEISAQVDLVRGMERAGTFICPGVLAKLGKLCSNQISILRCSLRSHCSISLQSLNLGPSWRMVPAPAFLRLV